MNKNKSKKIPSTLIPLSLKEAVEFDKTYFSIPIKESNEKLVDVEEVFNQKGIKAVFNNELTATGSKRLFLLREGLINPLLSASEEINKFSLLFRFEYMYRRLEDQEAAFTRSVKTFIKKYPELDKESILEIAGVFVASTPNTSAHVSGAAIDVVLVDKNFNPVDMGVPYIHPGPESKTTFPNLSKEAKRNRKILCEVMEKNGFANYPYEYWHFSMGDKIAAKIQDKTFAIYGPVIYNPNSNTTKEVKNGDAPFNVDYLFDHKL
ncbi:MAG: D-alanyl-D-alanine carboxypeptidase family protein [Candidatus Levybacteria bacterium]|nr:D-alanyl-D-alanine carboxypeptidase family protein [Candidatus Levybacteria bacterium]